MRNTEVPENVLMLAYEVVVEKLKEAFDKATDAYDNVDDATVTFTRLEIEHLEPLIKWVEYAVAVWAAED